MNRLSRLLIGCVLASMLYTATLAQAPKTQPLKPGPDHLRLHYFVGKWNFQGEVKASPFGPAGANTGTETIELGPNAFSIVFHNEVKGPAGVTRSMGIMSFDTGAKSYNYYGVDGAGNVSVGKGAATPNVWTWNTESKFQGRTVKGRAIISITSPAAYSYRFEMADDKNIFITIEEGKATKM